MPIFCLIFKFPEISFIFFISLIDSAFIWKQLFFIANSISLSVLPTPEKTIFSPEIPARRAF